MPSSNITVVVGSQHHGADLQVHARILVGATWNPWIHVALWVRDHKRDRQGFSLRTAATPFFFLIKKKKSAEDVKEERDGGVVAC